MQTRLNLDYGYARNDANFFSSKISSYVCQDVARLVEKFQDIKVRETRLKFLFETHTNSYLYWGWKELKSKIWSYGIVNWDEEKSQNFSLALLNE